MARQHFLTPADVRYQRGINRRVNGGKTSHQPRAKRRRGPRGDGARDPLRVGKVTTPISAATGPIKTQWGTGAVQFYNEDGTEDGQPVAVRNPHPTTFEINTSSVVNNQASPKYVVTGSCDPYP
jgi:hypothetical protein